MTTDTEALELARIAEQRRFDWEVAQLREHQKRLRETELLWMKRYGGPAALLSAQQEIL
jgi:hypothetical protein